MRCASFGALLSVFLVQSSAQERARDVPFSCEPVTRGSIVFRGVALERYDPVAEKPRPVRFKVEEPYFGIGPRVNEYEIILDSEEAISAGEERIVSSYPEDGGERWTAEAFDIEGDRAYLANLRGLASAHGASRLVGWTSGPDGSPLSNVPVQAIGPIGSYEVRSGEKGTFELAGIAPGMYRVFASRAQYETTLAFQEVEVLPGTCGVVSLPFRFQGEVEGALKDRRGNPLEGIHIDLQVFVDDEWSAYDSTQTDADGHYIFSGVEPGKYRAGINLRGRYDPYPVLYAPGVEDVKDSLTVILSTDEPREVADFWLPEPPLRRFEIQVFLPDGRPAAGAKIGLIFGRWPRGGSVQTDDRGMAVSDGYAMLRYRLYAYSKGSPGEQDFASRALVIEEGTQSVFLPLVLNSKPSEEGIPSPLNQ